MSESPDVGSYMGKGGTRTVSVPPCTALYRLLSAFTAFYRFAPRKFFSRSVGRSAYCGRRQNGWKIVFQSEKPCKFCRLLSANVAFCRLLSPPPRGSLVRGGGRREVRNFGKAPNSKDQAPPSAKATNEPPQDGSLWSSESLLPFRSASPRPIQAGRLCYPFPHGC